MTPRRSNPVKRALLVLVFLLIAGGLGGAGALWWSLHSAQGDGRQAVYVHVGQGDTVSTISSQLEREGLLHNGLLFRLDAHLHDLGSKLKVGDYQLRPNMSIDQMVGALTLYHARTIRITIPEGLRSEQIAVRLQGAGIDSKSFLQAVRHPSLHLSVLADKPPRASLEGYLFPNTYEVPPHYSGADFTALMVETLNRRFTPAMRAALRAQHRTIYAALILAAIVEREARIPAERPTIASVYVNRLKIGMPLQADPTVQYSVGKPGAWWPILTTDQLHVQNPYNTYVYRGLPPGPIANPGLASIQAAVHPAPTRFLFFVAKGHGQHAFAVTYDQQLANERRYGYAQP
jgi:UPF0755 protein